MSVLTDWFEGILNWFRKRRDEKRIKILALEKCLQNGLDDLIANTCELVVDLNGAKVTICFPVSVNTAEKIQYQAALEFRSRLQLSTDPFRASEKALSDVFDTVFYILEEHENCDGNKNLVTKFHKRLCDKHHKIVREDMERQHLLV